MSGRWRPEERSQKKGGRSPRMSREQSDGEDDVVGAEIDRVVNEIVETEVELGLPLGLAWNRARYPRVCRSLWGLSIWKSSRQTWRNRADLNPREGPNRSGSDTDYQYLELRDLVGSYRGPVGSGDDRFAFEMPSLTYSGPDRQQPSTATRPVSTQNDRFMFAISSPTYPGSGRQRPGPGIQPVRPESD